MKKLFLLLIVQVKSILSQNISIDPDLYNELIQTGLDAVNKIEKTRNIESICTAVSIGIMAVGSLLTPKLISYYRTRKNNEKYTQSFSTYMSDKNISQPTTQQTVLGIGISIFIAITINFFLSYMLEKYM